jgi:segregation and condensation protein B
MNLDVELEAILFVTTEPVTLSRLATFFDVPVDTVRAAAQRLAERLMTGGTRLTLIDDTIQLVAAPSCAPVIERLSREAVKGEIGKAGSETLAIILWRGPVSRVEIDRIRGVNSTFVLRNLLLRGLIERRDHPTDTRSFLYAATPELLHHLGLNRREELPEWQTVMDQLDAFMKAEAETALVSPSPL